MAPSKDPKFAEIAGRRFQRRFVTRFPPQPTADFDLARLKTYGSGPWAPFEASGHPLVPCAPLVSQGFRRVTAHRLTSSSLQLLWNFLWSSTDNRCDHTYPSGQRHHPYWEQRVLRPELPEDLTGFMTDDPHNITTERELRSPEERALLPDPIDWSQPYNDVDWSEQPEEVDWCDRTTPLPYDRFRRDVYNLANFLLHSLDWNAHKKKELQLSQWKDNSLSMVSAISPAALRWSDSSPFAFDSNMSGCSRLRLIRSDGR